MSKVTKKELQDRIEALEEFATYADNMLTELNHALPDPEYDAKCEAAVVGVEASLDRHRERLGLNKPQLKQLDQDDDIAKELLEVDLSSELTGSELCRAMINRGDKIVLCIVRDYEHENDIYYDAITYCSGDYFDSTLSSWRHATPINNQGEPLTASEVGL